MTSYTHDDKSTIFQLETLRNLVEKLDVVRPFLTSSPTNGLESEKEGWVAKNPYDVRYGDVHYYNYDDDCLDRSTYPLTRSIDVVFRLFFSIFSSKICLGVWFPIMAIFKISF